MELTVGQITSQDMLEHEFAAQICLAKLENNTIGSM